EAGAEVNGVPRVRRSTQRLEAVRETLGLLLREARETRGLATLAHHLRRGELGVVSTLRAGVGRTTGEQCNRYQHHQPQGPMRSPAHGRLLTTALDLTYIPRMDWARTPIPDFP